MIRLEIMSQMKAVVSSKTFSEKTAIVSITAPGQRQPSFADNPCIIGIFRMQFWDISSPVSGLKLPVQSDFDGLREFIDKMVQKEVAVIVVHCAAGISRSAGTAAAISDYLRLGAHIFDNPAYFPNRLAYRLARHEFGLASGGDWEILEELDSGRTASVSPQKLVQKIFRYVKKGKTTDQIAKKCHISTELAEKVVSICKAYPDAAVDEILIRMGIG